MGGVMRIIIYSRYFSESPWLSPRDPGDEALFMRGFCPWPDVPSVVGLPWLYARFGTFEAMAFLFPQAGTGVRACVASEYDDGGDSISREESSLALPLLSLTICWI